MALVPSSVDTETVLELIKASTPQSFVRHTRKVMHRGFCVQKACGYFGWGFPSRAAVKKHAAQYHDEERTTLTPDSLGRAPRRSYEDRTLFTFNEPQPQQRLDPHYQPPSRTTTPLMNGAPAMPLATPVVGHVTPRMNVPQQLQQPRPPQQKPNRPQQRLNTQQQKQIQDYSRTFYNKAIQSLAARHDNNPAAITLQEQWRARISALQKAKQHFNQQRALMQRQQQQIASI